MMGFKRNTPGGNAGCDACRVLSGLGDCTCRADKAFTPHPPVAAVQMPDTTLVASYPAYGNEHVGRIRRSRRIRRRGADAGCDAWRVLSGLRERTCRADKAFTPHPPVARCRCRMRRLPGLIRPGELTCRADKAFTPHPPAVANYCLRKKSLYNIYKCAALQEKFGAPCCAPVSGL